MAGRRTKLTWPDAFFVIYDYLVTGKMTKIRENGAASGIGVIGTIAYDDLGRRTSLTLGNGAVTGYTHDPVSRLQQMTQDLEGAGTSRDLTFGFAHNPRAGSPRPPAPRTPTPGPAAGLQARQGPSTTLRAVPLPGQCRGGIFLSPYA